MCTQYIPPPLSSFLLLRWISPWKYLDEDIPLQFEWLIRVLWKHEILEGSP